MADFQSQLAEYEKEEIKVMAMSVDPLDKAGEFAESIGVTFPVAHSVDGEAFSRLTGAFYDAEKKFLHATAYLLKPGGEISLACYSTGPVGRFVAADTLMLAKYYKSQA